MQPGRFYRRKKELTENQLNDLKDAFDAMDRNNDGHIHPQDFPVILRAIGHEPKKNEIKQFLDQVTKEGAGIDFDG